MLPAFLGLVFLFACLACLRLLFGLVFVGLGCEVSVAGTSVFRAEEPAE